MIKYEYKILLQRHTPIALFHVFDRNAKHTFQSELSILFEFTQITNTTIPVVCYTLLFVPPHAYRTPVAKTLTFPNFTSLSNCVMNCSSNIVRPLACFDFFNGPRLSISAHSVTIPRGSKIEMISPVRLMILGIPRVRVERGMWSHLSCESIKKFSLLKRVPFES